MVLVYLALGTNLGDREKNLREAIAHLSPQVTVTRESPVYETEPWGMQDQPRFLNMVVEGETALEPHALLDFLKRLERELGRTEGVRYGPRVIDLDILLYDDLVLSRDDLKIPHPRLAERRFVLVPLAAIAPDLLHPIEGVSIRALLARRADDHRVRLYGDLVQ